MMIMLSRHTQEPQNAVLVPSSMLRMSKSTTRYNDYETHTADFYFADTDNLRHRSEYYVDVHVK